MAILMEITKKELPGNGGQHDRPGHEPERECHEPLVEPVFCAKLCGIHAGEHEDVFLEDDPGQHEHEPEKPVVLEAGCSGMPPA